MNSSLLCSPESIEDPAVRERVVDLAERLHSPDGCPTELDALTDRREACAEVRELEDGSARLWLSPVLIEVFREEANRTFGHRAGAMLHRPISRAIRSDIRRVLDRLWGVSIVHAYEDAGESLASLLSPLVEVLHLDGTPRVSGGSILLLGKVAKWRPGALAQTVVDAGRLDDFASIVGAWLETVDERAAMHGARLLAAVATRFPDRLPSSDETLRSGLESTLRVDSVAARSLALLACHALGIEVQRGDGEARSDPRAYLRARLADSDDDVRAILVERLGRVVATDSSRDALVDPLVRRARERDDFERERILRAVGELVASEVESPRAAIGTLSMRVRNAVDYDQTRFARSLGHVAATYPEAVPETVRPLVAVVDRLETVDRPFARRDATEFLGSAVVAGDESTSCVFRAVRRERELDFETGAVLAEDSILPAAGAIALEAPELAPAPLRPILERARTLGDGSDESFLTAVGEVVLCGSLDAENVVSTLCDRVRASDGSRRDRLAWLLGASVAGGAAPEWFERSASVARTVVPDATGTERALAIAGEIAALQPRSVPDATDALTARIHDAERGSERRDRAAHALGELRASESAADPALDLLTEHVRTASGDERVAHAIALGEATAANRTTHTGALRTLVERARAARVSRDLDFADPIRVLSKAAVNSDVPLAQTHAPLVEWTRDGRSTGQERDQTSDVPMVVGASEPTADGPGSDGANETTVHPRRNTELPAKVLGETALATPSIVPDPVAAAARTTRESGDPSEADLQTLGLLVAAETPVARTLGRELLDRPERDDRNGHDERPEHDDWPGHDGASLGDKALSSIGETILSAPDQLPHVTAELCKRARSTSGLDRWLAVGGLARRSLRGRLRTTATLELLVDRVELTDDGFTGAARPLGELLVAFPEMASDSLVPLIEYHRQRPWRVHAMLDSEYRSLEAIGLLESVDEIEFATAVVTQVLSADGDLRRYVRQVVRATKHDVVSPADLVQPLEQALASAPAGPPDFFSGYRTHETESGMSSTCECGIREYADAFFELIAATAEHIPASPVFQTLREQLRPLLSEGTSGTVRDRLTITETLAQLDTVAAHAHDEPGHSREPTS